MPTEQIFPEDIAAQFPPSGSNFERFNLLAARYGAKAAGLLVLPQAWRPPFVLIPSSLHLTWRQGTPEESRTLDAVVQWLRSLSNDRAIVRSSGVTERIDDRGKFRSELISTSIERDKLSHVMAAMYDHASETDPKERLGLVVQEFLSPVFCGHLSNEVRLSPTRNQWKYDVERPGWLPEKGLNSKFAPLPESATQISCGGSLPHQALRSLGKWLTENVGPRCHVEWLTHNGSLWLVQLDFEWRQLDRGIDPAKTSLVQSFTPPAPGAADRLTPYTIGTDTEWKKLKNLSEFDFDVVGGGPQIFLLEASYLEALSDDAVNSLIEEVKAVTGNRAVVRTDCKQPDARQVNLPRTDTVTAENAVSWCTKQIEILRNEGISVENFAFLIHAFLPSKASAWAYSKLGSPIVVIDALWGLPDGLQVLSVDTYEVNVPQKRVIKTRSTYKPRFLLERADGRWEYQDVQRSKARSKVLKNPDILEIATRTWSIAKKLQRNAQIMWFCGVPTSFGVGRNVPWYRSRETLDAAPRIEGRYKPYSVKNPADLESLPDRQAMIRLSPDADLIRDEHFLQKVIDVAKDRKIPILLEGSTLGHIYYRLCQEGVGVVLANRPKYYRARDRRTFGKLVRDKIPLTIVSGGEAVVEAKLNKADIIPGLAGKLIEELEEFLVSNDLEEKRSELGDLTEVLRALAAFSGIEWDSVLRTMEKKESEKGGFLERRVLLETSLPHPQHQLEGARALKIQQLGEIEITRDTISFPIYLLIQQISQSSAVVKHEERGITLLISFHNGRVLITINDLMYDKEEENQLTFFDYLLTI